MTTFRFLTIPGLFLTNQVIFNIISLQTLVFKHSCVKCKISKMEKHVGRGHPALFFYLFTTLVSNLLHIMFPVCSSFLMLIKGEQTMTKPGLRSCRSNNVHDLDSSQSSFSSMDYYLALPYNIHTICSSYRPVYSVSV